MLSRARPDRHNPSQDYSAVDARSEASPIAGNEPVMRRLNSCKYFKSIQPTKFPSGESRSTIQEAVERLIRLNVLNPFAAARPSHNAVSSFFFTHQESALVTAMIDLSDCVWLLYLVFGFTRKSFKGCKK